MIAVDASAIVAILCREDGWMELAARLDHAPDADGARIASTITIWEAALGVARLHNMSRPQALQAVEEFLIEARIEPVAPDSAITRAAVDAAERYGMGAGQDYPGILNLGDCFSYATAKVRGARLLYKGDDFPKTDAEPA
ncbi:MAG: type II toxin-antitoxin system VapC family toxin [Beijerinckiaceae bacterium]